MHAIWVVITLVIKVDTDKVIHLVDNEFKNTKQLPKYLKPLSIYKINVIFKNVKTNSRS